VFITVVIFIAPVVNVILNLTGMWFYWPKLHVINFEIEKVPDLSGCNWSKWHFNDMHGFVL